MVRAIEATGRKKLIFAGLSLEVCAALPAMTAVSRVDAYVAVDACRTFSETKQAVAAQAIGFDTRRRGISQRPGNQKSLLLTHGHIEESLRGAVAHGDVTCLHPIAGII